MSIDKLSPLGTRLLKALTAAEPGKEIDFKLDSLIPTFGMPCQAFMITKEKKFFEINLYWLGIFVSAVAVECRGNDIVVDTL